MKFGSISRVVVSLALAFGVACGTQQSGVHKVDSSVVRSIPETATSTTTEPPKPLSGVDAKDGVGDPYFPLLGNGGFDIDHYLLVFDVEGLEGPVKSTTTITANATSNLKSFHLDYGGPELSDVSVDGVEAEFDQSGLDLTITPKLPVPIGEFTIEATYEGMPSSAPLEVGFPISVGWNTIGGSVVAIGQPYGSLRWFPSSDHPSDKATYRFEITVPRELTAVANGELEELRVLEDGSTYIWEMTTPMATNVASIAIGRFELVSSSSPEGIPILDAVPLGGDKTPGVVHKTGPMLDRFVERFGPYPFKSYGTLVVDSYLGFALEQQGRSLFGLDLIDVEPILAHELGHQWFGDSVSPSTWQDLWLNEGFATYTEWWWEEITGSTTMRANAESVLGQILNGDPDLVVPPSDPGPDLFGRTVYVRAGAALVALELHLGVETFDQLVAEWIDRYSGSDASTDDFMEIVEEFGGSDALALFEPWIYGGSDPVLPA